MSGNLAGTAWTPQDIEDVYLRREAGEIWETIQSVCRAVGSDNTIYIHTILEFSHHPFCVELDHRSQGTANIRVEDNGNE